MEINFRIGDRRVRVRFLFTNNGPRFHFCVHSGLCYGPIRGFHFHIPDIEATNRMAV